MENEVKQKMISKSKLPGRPKTYREPVLVRFDKATLKQLDMRRKRPKARSRPSMIRWIVFNYFGQAHDQA
jgi:hypothetical protein